jgi:hypothetical protein
LRQGLRTKKPGRMKETQGMELAKAQKSKW